MYYVKYVITNKVHIWKFFKETLRITDEAWAIPCPLMVFPNPLTCRVITKLATLSLYKQLKYVFRTAVCV